MQRSFFDIIQIVLFNRLPDLPAFNKWLKQFSPNVWWLIGFCLLITPIMFLWSQHGRSGSDQLEFSAEDLMGPTDTEVVKAINRSRNRKTNLWVRDMPRTRDVLAATTLLYQILMLALYESFTLGYTFVHKLCKRVSCDHIYIFLWPYN
jgi:hypothetical protein